MRFKFFLVILIILGGALFTKYNHPQIKQIEKNTPRAFISEVYDKVMEHYWEKITEAQLIELFKASSEAQGKTLSQEIKTKDELLKNIEATMAAKITDQVLASLQPIGRSRLYTEKQEEQLKNTVNNVDPNKDLYKNLGVAKGASEAAVMEAYQKKEEELKKDNSTEAKQKLKEIAYAKTVLTEKETKKRYDTGGVEPTIFTTIYGNILYVAFKKFSPTSFDEFQKAFESNKDKALDGLILDLRGNVGGAIDSTAYFLGLFLGQNQSAFEFYHKGDFKPFRTPTAKLPSLTRFRQVVILVDNQTQSSAEMMTASLKKYHLGVVLGSPTKGWGTVERVFPIDNQFDKANKYSLFLVHSITLRDDNQPIEGRGVDPDIKLTEPTWPQQLFSYFRNQDLIQAVKNVL